MHASAAGVGSEKRHATCRGTIAATFGVLDAFSDRNRSLKLSGE